VDATVITKNRNGCAIHIRLAAPLPRCNLDEIHLELTSDRE
jgi:hypothetical protein